ncbi:3-hydroxyacyl-CoA dehydrogenase NAD-binding domain-containing protein [Tumebacillus sp. DT12]|uniref:3-hydroxyacyl-CoA dehydrogenase NAD-binding domain-containing protein n=1 Tax=Tumebacillus lacus TaxID=2995335 RepID=A0ABT3X1Z6_9BACL|nr:3-hydroxyacyl-CoA dehydrogenase NAD-binding domain-containing protein [Tumebacillus lacus]MCX7568729.1 3-hydroxyacyl-CoA dehydrogenase NAD-binding domain-containing protein [Tumebacillus lacus]
MNINSVGIVGAGTMGIGLAEMIAEKGLDVVLIDKSETELNAARVGLELSLDRRLTKWGITEAEKKGILSRIRLASDLTHLAECSLVVESVWEVLEDKIQVLQQIEAVVGAETVIASNTSTLSITEIAAQIKHPERVIGLHFHYPPLQRDVVELVRGLHTSEQTVDDAMALVRELDKTAVRVFESPGYITSRLMMPLINEATLILAEGVATSEDIDLAMKAGYGFSHGPLELADRFGLDSCLDILESLFHDTADPKYRPAAYLRKLVRAGHLGIKSKIGFYRYDESGERLEGRR